jgi:hypothetical protein
VQGQPHPGSRQAAEVQSRSARYRKMLPRPEPGQAQHAPSRAQWPPYLHAMLTSSSPAYLAGLACVERSDSVALASNRPHFKHSYDEPQTTGSKKQANCVI